MAHTAEELSSHLQILRSAPIEFSEFLSSISKDLLLSTEQYIDSLENCLKNLTEENDFLRMEARKYRELQRTFKYLLEDDDDKYFPIQET